MLKKTICSIAVSRVLKSKAQPEELDALRKILMKSLEEQFYSVLPVAPPPQPQRPFCMEDLMQVRAQLVREAQEKGQLVSMPTRAGKSTILKYMYQPWTNNMAGVVKSDLF